MFTRQLGLSGIKVSAMGVGCWAIGGPVWRGDRPSGWGQVDDKESLRAVQRALDLGITFFDTADVYGAGHSERIVGQALAGKRDKVVIATKFGNVFDEQTLQITAEDGSPEYIRRACDASLRRLKIDVIDLYQFHIGDYDLDRALATRDTLEELVAAGKIRYYGWSTDDTERARLWAGSPHYTSVQQRLNIFEGNTEILGICDRFGLASINRGPLGKGLLTGKFDASSTFPTDDNRRDWNFREGSIAEHMAKLTELQDVLTSGGRTLAQAALGWIWAKSARTVPIPGFKTVKQIEENAGALQRGPLSGEQMKQIEGLLGR